MYELSFDIEYNYQNAAIGIEVPISLSVGGRTIDIAAKVDTGAPSCIFAHEVGEELGLHVESGQIERFSTAIGGSFSAFGHTIQMRSLGVLMDSLVYFAADPAFRRNVIGRKRWREHVRVALIDYERLLYLAPYNRI